MTYGWVFIVVMIVGIIMWQLGLVVDPPPENNLTNEECLDFCKQVTGHLVDATACNKGRVYKETHCVCYIEHCAPIGNNTLCLKDELKFTINNTI